MNKKLFRSRSDSTIAGVCGGLGEYFNIDPTFLRIIFVLLIFADGIGIIAYIIAWIVMPQRPLEAAGVEPQEKNEPVKYGSWNKYIPGAILIALGVFFIVREHYWWWHIERFWPVLLIIFGLFLVFRLGGQRQKEENHEPSQI